MNERRADDPDDTEHAALLFFLNRVRDATVRTAEGPSETDQRAPGVPSGTNLLGLIHHLTAMEVHWFQRVFLGLPHDVDPSMQVPGATSGDDVITAYRTACRESDRIVAACPDLSTLSTADARLPISTAGDADPSAEQRVSLRRIVIHMIEETARHAGHADILRERLDGATDL